MEEIGQCETLVNFRDKDFAKWLAEAHDWGRATKDVPVVNMNSNPGRSSASSDESKELVVFIVRRETRCNECGEELGRGRWIRAENDEALCLSCTDLAHLEFLPSGNTALTRRTSKYSPLGAVVVQRARARQRYERQGILAT